MAIIHQASITPTKGELLDGLFGEPTVTLGAYRFDDPAGEVGIEGFVVAVGAATRHVVLSYRAAPLEDAAASLVSTMEHSVLGRRWIYDASADPVAMACFARALRGEQQQASEEIWDGTERVAIREPSARVELVSGAGPLDAETAGAAAPVIVTDLDAALGDRSGARLVARWDGGSATVAY